MDKKFEEMMNMGFKISMYKSDDGWFYIHAEDNNDKLEGAAEKLVDAKKMLIRDFELERRRRAENMQTDLAFLTINEDE